MRGEGVLFGCLDGFEPRSLTGGGVSVASASCLMRLRTLVENRAKRAGLSEEELANLWKQVKNSQGRIYYQHTVTGERSWERPEGASVLSLDEVQREEEMVKEDLRAEGDKADGGSLIMRAIEHFWSIAAVAHKAYWVAAAGVFVWVGYEVVLYALEHM